MYILSLLETAIHSAIKAGEQILNIYHEPFSVRYKEDNSPVTKADILSGQIIARDLLPSGIPVISEEEEIPGWETRKNYTKLWMVDPLDGTKEFVKRNGEFSVNIALVENNYPVLGVIFMPVLKELYFASQSIGAFKLDHETMSQNQVHELSIHAIMQLVKKLPLGKPGMYTAVASRSHLSKETYAWLEGKKREYGPIDIIYSGSSVKMCWVAEGKANAYPRYGTTMEWDTAAGQAIVECAGGEFLDLTTGNRLCYNKQHLENPHFIAKNQKNP